VFDLRVLHLLQTSFRQPFSPFRGVEPKAYLGSPASLAVWCDGQVFKERVQRADPSLHAFMFDGAGLEQFVSQPSWQLRPPGD
jgi:aminoglycoside phosphotransferase (APT) family kinase protein